MNIIDPTLPYVFKALEPRTSAIPADPQQPRNRISSAPVEGSSPTDDAGTASVVDPNYDGAPYCSYGHRTKSHCDCRPSADSE